MSPFNEYLEVSQLVTSMAGDFGYHNNPQKKREAIEKVLDYRYKNRREESPITRGGVVKGHILEEIKIVRDTFKDNNNKKEV